ncbi:MAG: vitamin B12-dependent ribonucleotide reductase [Candidatus Omnitrophica bacterium]|nr:vitamin B12-dependent ribonucleotide reductase [Candidatus Omnitrophota bacterium]
MSTKLFPNALKVLERRYLSKNENGEIIETPEELFSRVARTIASADRLYNNPESEIKKTEEIFYEMMANLEFMPNSPCLMNAGKELGQLSACFTLPVDDSIDGIFETLKITAIIHKSGGGTGFSFSKLRPQNSVVQTTKGIASGPVSFMKVYDAATEAIKQGGTRRGANMGILRVDHPDILEFITCKDNPDVLTNFNISVSVTDEFIDKLKKGEKYNLIDPHSGQVKDSMDAEKVFDLISSQAHKNGDPGIIFIDRINKTNPTPRLGEIESTNPCGEQPLLPYESCDLGSINLSNMVHKLQGSYQIDWKKLQKTVHNSVHFLDNLIDVNKFPVPQIEKMTKMTRKIGLGIMGWATLLTKLNISYNSQDALQLAEKIMGFILEEAKNKSLHLAELRGTFPAYPGSIYEKEGLKLRNSTLTTIAPTGTISIIAGPCSSGIEPIFALSYFRNVMDNDKLIEIDPVFEEVAKERNFYTRELMEKITECGSVQKIDGIPQDIKRVFVTAHDIEPEWHVRMQAAFQKYVHNAVSKTVNLPESATKDDVRKIFLLADELKCKGVTIYRNKSREKQVLNISKEPGPLSVKGKITPKPRPDITMGTTTKVTTGCGNLYVTVNCDKNGSPFEVFIQMGKAGGCAASQLEAIGRLTSLCLRSGVNAESIVEQLKNIRCPSPSYQKGIKSFSCADSIARVVEETIKNFQTKKQKKNFPGDPPTLYLYLDDKLKNPKNITGICPDCGEILTYEEGCSKCYNCGFSRC